MEVEDILPFDKRPTLVSQLIFINQAHAFPFCFFKIHFNIVSSMPRCFWWCLSFRFPHYLYFTKENYLKNLKILLFLSEQIHLH